ncbi:MAG: hypothetical protein N5P05_002698 [Chroococcopsis gigantea SAG 12.99]|jgi:hypothetical protein|nr:hypothetical protein [Chlorogloea purpurea SAG 13.99]MDV3001092.1 hypothetical protein [Chroococcopsis gigantea SAG 12.99]
MKRISILPPRELKNPDLAAKFALTLIGYGILNTLRADLVYFFLLFVAGVSAIFWRDILRHSKQSRIISWMVLTGFLTAGFIAQFSGAAQAVWLDNIESWMSSAFPQSTALATLIFSVMRAFYVLYLIASGIGVFIAARRQEGLWEAVQLPLLSLLIIGVVDVVAGFIVT